MRVAVWSAFGRFNARDGAYMTGVGKHVVNMVGGLAHRQGWDVRLLCTSDIHDRDRAHEFQSAWADIPAVRLPIERRVAETLWRTLKWPNVDLWTGDVDWVYCPRELYVPVRGA